MRLVARCFKNGNVEDIELSKTITYDKYLSIVKKYGRSELILIDENNNEFSVL